ncbi:hypothetical protein AGMMS49574_11670 [Bacteroidia bacterium]|nr:hypothetical protein AGMMS49574_11670 [Bacteroidia bacterium]
MALSDFLTNEQKAKLITTAISPGEVYWMNLTPEEGVTPKEEDENRDKFFVVMGLSDEQIVGFLLINTHINQNITEELQLLHYPVSEKKYPFLKKPRYIYCGELKEISREKFTSMFSSPIDKIKEDDMECIIQTLIKDSPIKPKILKRFHLIL